MNHDAYKFRYIVINIILKKGGMVLECKLNQKIICDSFNHDILPVLPQKISLALGRIQACDMRDIEEIRMRAGKPLMVFLRGKDFFINNNGFLRESPESVLYLDRSDIEKTLQIMSDFSIYAIEEELKQGFITIKGGHRIGLCGRIVLEGNVVKTIKNISGMNIRIAKEVKGCSADLVKKLYSSGLKHTLIASPPNCGKTTLLRDMIRLLSGGYKEGKINGYKVGIVDERSEIAGCYLGVPQRDVGVRTDVLDACPKVQGMIMMLRSMSPDVIAVDEIGSLQDADAIEDVVNAGVKIIATAHGRDINEIKKRPGVCKLIEENAFERIVILSRRKGPGTIEEILFTQN